MKQHLRLLGRFVFGKLLPKGIPYPVFMGPLKGEKFVLGSMGGEGGGATTYFNMMEPEQTKKIAEVLQRGACFIDIGANVGYYTILASRIVGTQGSVIAFEPVLRNLAYLHQHIVINRVQNVRVLTMACSDNFSLGRFLMPKTYAEGYLGEGESSVDISSSSTTLVPTITLDTIVEELKLSPNVIKIDVEGAELKVLRGAEKTLSQWGPTIFLSVHSPELQQSCLEYLRRMNYQVNALTKGSINASEYIAVR